MVLLGFSSGLPFATTFGTLQAWMKDVGVDLTIIGIFGLVRLPYTLKFLWSPFVDRFVPPFLGRRRGWALISQLALMLLLCGMGLCDPQSNPYLIACLALAVSFFSATQDIVLDAHRRDSLADSELGLGSSLFITGYRLALLFSGGFAFWLATVLPWGEVYFILASGMLVGILAIVLSDAESDEVVPPKSIREAIIGPLADYFTRSKAVEILIFILLYKLGDMMVSAMTTPFILRDFTKQEYFAIVKSFGLIALLSGGVLGGAFIVRIGINRALWYFGSLQVISNLGFAFLATTPGDSTVLTAVIVFENLSAGLGTAAYAAYMGALCNKRFSATQYALLSSFMGVPAILFSATSGYLASMWGWELYFIGCTLCGIPGMCMLVRLAPMRKGQEGG